MRIDGSAVRAGMVIDFENKLWTVVKHEIRTPGNLRAFNQVELKDVKSGIKKNVRFSSGESIDRVRLDQRVCQYLYDEGDMIAVMDQTNFEQFSISKALFGDAIAFLQDDMMIALDMYEETPINGTLPEQVVLKITDTEPTIKGQTASSSYKPATLENGVRILVPPFIESGTKVVVNTVDSSYIERYKESA